MTLESKRLISVAACVAALVLAVYFVQYRVQPIRMCPGAVDVSCATPDTIVRLGLTEIEPQPGSLLARYHGRTAAERVLVARNGYVPESAAVWGIIFPVLLIFGAFLLTRRTKIQTETMPK